MCRRCESLASRTVLCPRLYGWRMRAFRYRADALRGSARWRSRAGVAGSSRRDALRASRRQGTMARPALLLYSPGALRDRPAIGVPGAPLRRAGVRASAKAPLGRRSRCPSSPRCRAQGVVQVRKLTCHVGVAGSPDPLDLELCFVPIAAWTACARRDAVIGQPGKENLVRQMGKRLQCRRRTA